MLAIGATLHRAAGLAAHRAASTILLIGGVAITGAIGQWGITEAFKHAPGGERGAARIFGAGLGDPDRPVVWSVMPEWRTLAGRGGDHRQRALPVALRGAARGLISLYSVGSVTGSRSPIRQYFAHGDRDRASNPAADHGRGALRALHVSRCRTPSRLLTIYMKELEPFIIFFGRLRWHRVTPFEQCTSTITRAVRWRSPRSRFAGAQGAREQIPVAGQGRAVPAPLPHLSRRGRLHEAFAASASLNWVDALKGWGRVKSMFRPVARVGRSIRNASC